MGLNFLFVCDRRVMKVASCRHSLIALITLPLSVLAAGLTGPDPLTAFDNICSSTAEQSQMPRFPIAPPEALVRAANSTPLDIADILPVGPDVVAPTRMCSDPPDSGLFSEINTKLRIAEADTAVGDTKGAQTARNEAGKKVEEGLDQVETSMPNLVSAPVENPSGRPPLSSLPGSKDPAPLDVPVAADYVRQLARLAKDAMLADDPTAAASAGRQISDFVDSQLQGLYEERMSVMDDYARSGRKFDDISHVTNTLRSQIASLKLMAELLDPTKEFDAYAFEQDYVRRWGDAWRTYAMVEFNKVGCHPDRSLVSELWRAVKNAMAIGSIPAEDDGVRMIREAMNARVRDLAQRDLVGAERDRYVNLAKQLGLDDLAKELTQGQVTPLSCEDEGSLLIRSDGHTELPGEFDVTAAGKTVKYRWNIHTEEHLSTRFILLRQDKRVEDGDSKDEKIVTFKVRIEVAFKGSQHAETSAGDQSSVENASANQEGLVAPSSLDHPLLLKLHLRRATPPASPRLAFDFTSIPDDAIFPYQIPPQTQLPNPTDHPNLDPDGFLLVPAPVVVAEGKTLRVLGEMHPELVDNSPNPLNLATSGQTTSSFDLHLDIEGLWPSTH